MAENPADIKSNDYLAALVRKVSQLKEVPKNILHADEVRKMQGDPAALAKFIDGKPHLQEQLCSLTDFTPSRWLLAQEIPAIRRRRFLQTKNDYTFDPTKDDPYEWKETGRCKAHHVRGRIRYPETPAKVYGEILYIKSSLTGTIIRENQEELPCETIDILNYRFEHGTFPHDTTANQWFTESQFESYRRLGQHMVAEIGLNDDWKGF